MKNTQGYKKILLERRLQLPGDDIRPVDMFEEWMCLYREQRSSCFFRINLSIPSWFLQYGSVLWIQIWLDPDPTFQLVSDPGIV